MSSVPQGDLLSHVTGCTIFVLAGNCGCGEKQLKPPASKQPGGRLEDRLRDRVPPTHVPGGCVRACPCLAAAASGAVPSASAAPAVTATCGPRHCCPRTPRTPGAHGPGEDQRQGPRGSFLSLLVHGRSLQPPAGEPGPAGAQVRTGERGRALGTLRVGSPSPGVRGLPNFRNLLCGSRYL